MQEKWNIRSGSSIWRITQWLWNSWRVSFILFIRKLASEVGINRKRQSSIIKKLGTDPSCTMSNKSYVFLFVFDPARGSSRVILIIFSRCLNELLGPSFCQRAIENLVKRLYIFEGRRNRHLLYESICLLCGARCSTNHPERFPAGSIWVKDDKNGQHVGVKTNQQHFWWKKLVACQIRSTNWNLLFKETANDKAAS